MKSFMKNRIMQALASRARVARVLAAVLVAGLFMSACGGSTEPGVTASVTISPTSATIAVLTSTQFTVVVKNADGDVLNVTPTWSVSGGGTITQSGVFTAGPTAGTSIVSVTCSGITVNATVTVTAGALLTITVTPNPGTMPINTSLQYTATGRDANNNVVSGLTFVWSVVNGGGTVNATGLFLAGGVAATFSNTVQAAVGTINGKATAIVTTGPLASIAVTPQTTTLAPGGTQVFTAVGRDAGGNVISPFSPVWAVLAPNNGTIVDTGTPTGPHTATFTAGATVGSFPNSVQASANSGAIHDEADVIVTAGPGPGLGASSSFGIIAGQTITCVTGGTINADIALTPGSAVTLGTPPCVVTGATHINDGVATQAQADNLAQYNALVALPCPPGNVIGTANIGGTTKTAGVYCSASSIQVSGTLTLDGGGDPNAVFVFQAGSTLTNAPPPGNIVLIGMAQAKNVWWAVGSSATIGTGSSWMGNILSVSSITLNDNVTLTGRAWAQAAGAVTLGTGDTIILP